MILHLADSLEPKLINFCPHFSHCCCYDRGRDVLMIMVKCFAEVLLNDALLSAGCSFRVFHNRHPGRRAAGAVHESDCAASLPLPVRPQPAHPASHVWDLERPCQGQQENREWQIISSHTALQSQGTFFFRRGVTTHVDFIHRQGETSMCTSLVCLRADLFAAMILV